MRRVVSFLALATLASLGRPSGADVGVFVPCPRESEPGGDLERRMKREQSEYLRIGDCFPPLEMCDWRKEPFPSPDPNEGREEKPGVGAGCPSGTVRIDSFCMDAYAASLQRVLDDGTTRPWSPYHNPTRHNAGKVRAVSLEGAIPQSGISRKEAEAACAASGKRLCSAKEWLRACQGPGPEPRLFPYGGKSEADRVPGACNDHVRPIHPAVELWQSMPAGERPESPFTGKAMNNACVLQRPQTLVRNGALKRCVTPEGVHDLVGNIHEWTSESRPNGNGVFRGGYFMDTKINGSGCRYATRAHAPSYWDYSTGFRCCADPAP